jgi:hypothetical protein
LCNSHASTLVSHGANDGIADEDTHIPEDDIHCHDAPTKSISNHVHWSYWQIWCIPPLMEILPKEAPT